MQAEIRTIDDQVDDVLWVTDRWGHKITSEPKLRELRMSLILIEHFSSRLPCATDPEAALVHFSRFATETMARPDWVEEFEALEKPEVLDALVRMLGESHFLWEDYLHAQPENVLHMICDPAEWTRHPGQKQLTSTGLGPASADNLNGQEASLSDDSGIVKSSCADLRSILGLSRGRGGVFRRVAAVAEEPLFCLQSGSAPSRWRRTFQGDMNRIPPSVLCLALGKFGGSELGFASDLEVMIVYDDRARSAAGSRSGSGEFFDSAVCALRESNSGEAGKGTPSSSISVFARTAAQGLSPRPSRRFVTIIVPAGRPGVMSGRLSSSSALSPATARLGREVERITETEFVDGPGAGRPRGSAEHCAGSRSSNLLPGTIRAKHSPALWWTSNTWSRPCRSHTAPLSRHSLAGVHTGKTGSSLGEPVAWVSSRWRRYGRATASSVSDSMFGVVRDHSRDLTVPDSALRNSCCCRAGCERPDRVTLRTTSNSRSRKRVRSPSSFPRCWPKTRSTWSEDRSRPVIRACAAVCSARFGGLLLAQQCPHPIVNGSVQPILDSQARHSFEIGSVGGQEKCVVDQSRSRDFQIHCADAKLLPAEIVKLLGRSLIERHDFKLLVELEQQGQFSITENLPQCRFSLAITASQPRIVPRP